MTLEFCTIVQPRVQGHYRPPVRLWWHFMAQNKPAPGKSARIDICNGGLAAIGLYAQRSHNVQSPIGSEAIQANVWRHPAFPLAQLRSEQGARADVCSRWPAPFDGEGACGRFA